MILLTVTLSSSVKINKRLGDPTNYKRDALKHNARTLIVQSVKKPIIKGEKGKSSEKILTPKNAVKNNLG